MPMPKGHMPSSSLVRLSTCGVASCEEYLIPAHRMVAFVVFHNCVNFMISVMHNYISLTRGSAIGDSIRVHVAADAITGEPSVHSRTASTNYLELLARCRSGPHM